MLEILKRSQLKRCENCIVLFVLSLVNGDLSSHKNKGPGSEPLIQIYLSRAATGQMKESQRARTTVQPLPT